MPAKLTPAKKVTLTEKMLTMAEKRKLASEEKKKLVSKKNLTPSPKKLTTAEKKKLTSAERRSWPSRRKPQKGKQSGEVTTMLRKGCGQASQKYLRSNACPESSQPNSPLSQPTFFKEFCGRGGAADARQG